MARDHIEFVALDLAAQVRLRLPGDDPSTQLCCHLVDFTRRQIQLLGDLLLGQIQAHQIEAEHPDAERLVMSGEDGPGQVIEISAALPAVIALAGTLSIVAPTFPDVAGPAVRTLQAIGPAHLADGFITFVVINQLLHTDHADSMQAMTSLSKTFQVSDFFSSPKPELSHLFFSAPRPAAGRAAALERGSATV